MYQWLYWFLYSVTPIQYEDVEENSDSSETPEPENEIDDDGMVATPFIKSSNLQK